MAAAPHSFRYVSTKRRVREDRRFVAGRAVYVSDVTPPGCLHAAVLTSPHPCARVAAIDAAEALFAERGLDGVTTREILDAAGQKNQSALQYHFGSREGLILALVRLGDRLGVAPLAVAKS